jgi:hypothetical protein
LTLEAIEAANRLYKSLQDASEPDNTLHFLATKLPGFGPEETLLKVVAVNSLYSTNVYAVRRMADHVRKVMCRVRPDSDPAKVVEQLSNLPPGREGEKGRRFISFASKFAHFFCEAIDSERFPIFDSYAVWMIQYHLGTRGCAKNDEHPYEAFLQNLEQLRNQCGFRGCLRDLDGYLWMAGELRSWSKKPDMANTEMRRLFEHPSEGAKTDLQLLASGLSVELALRDGTGTASLSG